ncbi:MAG: hypothetical protein GYB36_07530 [Alphaproteobacteria bacterium]|nr:hypothetical protein [Alphaproteobacteria bacterium]
MEYLRRRLEEIPHRGSFVVEDLVFDPYELKIRTSTGYFALKDEKINAKYRANSFRFDISTISEDEKFCIRDVMIGSSFIVAEQSGKITLNSCAWTIFLKLSPNGFETLNFQSIDGDFVAI